MRHTLLNFLPVGEQEIKSLKVMCSNCDSGCGWVGELRSLDDHLKMCGHALIRCTNECMENDNELRILRRDLDQHLKDKCPNRQHQCPHCKDTGRYCDITTTHLDTCPKLEVFCPNSGCKVSVFRCNLSSHRSKCQYETVPCKYAGIGCDKKLPHKDIKQHENDDAFHLHLAIETVTEQQRAITAIKDELDGIRNALALKEQKDNIMAGPCVFKMPGFSRLKYSKQTWYSPPFYTYPGGYKMCIRVDANGFGPATGTGVSVYAYLMKGKNDDNLPWPFTGEVTITLLNQLEDENHYTRTISFPQYNVASMRVVDDDRGSAIGHSKFISKDKLDYDAENFCQYLKDDCLYIRIEVEAAEPVKPWLTCTA